MSGFTPVSGQGQHDPFATLCAFDLLELDGQDLRREPLEQRKRALARLGGAAVLILSEIVARLEPTEDRIELCLTGG